MQEILPQQIIFLDRQLYAAINEELVKLIPANEKANFAHNEQSARAAQQYEKGVNDFQAIKGTAIHVTGRDPQEIKPKVYAIPIRWDIYKFFHEEAPDLQTAIERAWKTAEREFLATENAVDDTLRIDDIEISQQYPHEEQDIDWGEYPN